MDRDRGVYELGVLSCSTAHLLLVGYLFMILISLSFFFFFFNDTATTEIYTLSLHDALPICENVEYNVVFVA